MTPGSTVTFEVSGFNDFQPPKLDVLVVDEGMAPRTSPR